MQGLLMASETNGVEASNLAILNLGGKWELVTSLKRRIFINMKAG